MKYLKYFESLDLKNTKTLNIITNLLYEIGIRSLVGTEGMYIAANMCSYENSILSMTINSITGYKEKTYLVEKGGHVSSDDLKIYISNENEEDTILTKYSNGNYISIINKILSYYQDSIIDEIYQQGKTIETSLIRNLIINYLKYIRNLTEKQLKGNLKIESVYKIIYNQIKNDNSSHKVFNFIKTHNIKIYKEIEKYSKMDGFDMQQSNGLDDMGFMDSVKYISEHNYSHLRKQEPFNHGTVNSVIKNKTKEGGVVLILSNPFPDSKSRVYMGIINNVRGDNESKTERVDLISQFSILKLYPDGNIYPEKVSMETQQRYDILGMKTSGLYLNNNKTPLWEVSSGLNKPSFFTQYQNLIKNLTEQYNIVFPITQSKQKPNLHL